MLSFSVVAALAVAGWWWVTWPERTAREFIDLVAEGKAVQFILRATNLVHAQPTNPVSESIPQWNVAVRRLTQLESISGTLHSPNLKIVVNDLPILCKHKYEKSAVANAFVMGQLRNIPPYWCESGGIPAIRPTQSELSDDLYLQPKCVLQWNRIGRIEQGWEFFRT